MQHLPLTIIGPGSRLARQLALPAAGPHYSLRQGERLPSHLGGTIVVFADPPGVEATRVGMLDVLSRIPLHAGAHVILVSSISAGFADSGIYPCNGVYSQRKRLAEQLVQSREDIGNTVIRVGNVLEYGGWHAIFSQSRLAILPSGTRQVAVADLAALRRSIVEATEGGPGGTIEAFVLRDVDTCFRRVIRLPGLFALYRSRPGKLVIKIAARLLGRAKVFLCSPDDLNAFLMEAR